MKIQQGTYSRQPRIAIVTQDLRVLGGLFTATAFLRRVLMEQTRYECDIISLAMSSRDPCSALLHAPATWKRGIASESITHRGMEITHIGAWLGELELQRYQPRKALTSLLAKYDLVQFVVGFASWANVARHIQRPVCIWPASTFTADRASRMQNASILLRIMGSLTNPMIKAFERRALHNSRMVFALSKYTYSAVQAGVQPGRLVLAPCGVDTTYYSPRFGASGRYILSVGRFSDPRKNIKLLFSAYSLLLATDPGAPDLYLVGTKPEKGADALASALGIKGKLRMLGTKSDDELRELYQDACCFVLSSDEEGLGIVLLEAMACGVPVVSTRCGGPETIISDGENGILTPVKDAKALASGLQRVLFNTEFHSHLRAKGRDCVEAKFSLHAAGKIFLDKYDEILATPMPSNSTN